MLLTQAWPSSGGRSEHEIAAVLAASTNGLVLLAIYAASSYMVGGGPCLGPVLRPTLGRWRPSIS
ncbi:hypothetical protein AC579_6996 [Pseudocercospora musae]|uniref:Uncharacterized protein n=1 Tax=Pseudocercospora musae TaxID=113226 RepID=A0A139I9P2_9PEZI|nr:hypothetical protein AC579_6996 [Pseudocercospora musae]